MIAKFEETGSFDVKPGRGRRPVSAAAVEDVATALQEQTSSDAGISSARGMSRMLDMPISTVRKVLRNILRCYPYKITHVQQLLPADLKSRESFALQFLARMEVDKEWPWNILWSDEAHFHLHGSVNTQNCRIWATENPFHLHSLPLHSEKVTVWCGITATFIVGPFFFEEITPAGPVTCTVTGKRYEALLRNHVLPALQQRQCVDRTIFMQDGAPPHIATSVKQLLRAQFGVDRIISRHFPTTWPPRSPDLNPCDFWLWGYLKSVVYNGRIQNLADLKASITHHIHCISADTLRSVVEHAVLRFQLVAEQGGGHIEQLVSNHQHGTNILLMIRHKLFDMTFFFLFLALSLLSL
ncbi:transposable element tc3 transposase [Lasius niger]|uniref:Transposable element tc3 transposase n=1 Tax=Lasius niger TaxID=67767 RepID=A0A0J7JXQ4_LASNI|nr:transposable element tc3 transposase [Lasius niger]